MKYKVAIVDDHLIFRIGLKTALSVFKDLEIVIDTDDGNELIKELSSKKVDVNLLDLKMPIKSG